MKFRKKPVVIEAMKFETNNDSLDANMNQIVNWITKNGGTAYHDCTDIFIKTLEGEMRSSVGDFIIKGVKGEFYSCRGDIFAQTYEKVDDESNSAKSFEQKMENLKDVIKIQCSKGNYDYDDYMFGMANGLILAEHIMKDDGKEIVYMESPNKDLLPIERFYKKWKREDLETRRKFMALLVGPLEFHLKSGVTIDQALAGLATVPEDFDVPKTCDGTNCTCGENVNAKK